jgi:hypothetical protein
MGRANVPREAARFVGCAFMPGSEHVLVALVGSTSRQRLIVPRTPDLTQCSNPVPAGVTCDGVTRTASCTCVVQDDWVRPAGGTPISPLGPFALVRTGQLPGGPCQRQSKTNCEKWC